MTSCALDIRELSRVFDGESRPTYVSLYSDGTDPRFIHRRRQAIRSALPSHLRENFQQTMQEVTRYLNDHGSRNVALFASAAHDFFKAVSLTDAPPNLLVVDSSPYIRPLAALDDQWEGFTLVLMNTHHAKIYSVACSDIAREKELSREVMNKHKKGGMSQARFQRLRRGSIHHFYQDLRGALPAPGSQKIILAGPGEAKHQFLHHLSPPLQENVVALIDAPMDGEQELWEDSIHAMREHGQEVKGRLLDQLKKEILTDGLAAYGVSEVTRAARNGQVEVLFVERGHRQRGWLCERCQRLGTGTAPSCPTCGKPVTTVDVLEEIMEFAQRTGAPVTFVDDDFVGQMGHVAALLRYRTENTGEAVA
ncbi:MAG: Vms1/Ankzf1 family peptidyl-tRNA hydrolase [Candidatus Thermoplasmatota archaeon]|nr:Vms1/Ankzf1 family peptidyl-tRNA hydrolase [Candidatus Thermoplasmatota archaeon]MDD5777873.1 Vms1/Ankzf1 family peptidyl-tRNA hydrolase [Candidatus Thermoplasmatota archaeon]